jgi:hypothetical protein
MSIDSMQSSCSTELATSELESDPQPKSTTAGAISRPPPRFGALIWRKIARPRYGACFSTDCQVPRGYLMTRRVSASRTRSGRKRVSSAMNLASVPTK